MVPGYDSRQARTTLAGLTKPDPKERAEQIVAWAICWPWNLVWTLCVYNPFRYVGEFLLREIHSTLFEISSGQFRAIEQDLTLEPLPPPYPVSELTARHENFAAQELSVEVSNVSEKTTAEVDSLTAQSAAEETVGCAPADRSPTVEPAVVESVTVEARTVEAVADVEQREPAFVGQLSEEIVIAEAENEGRIKDFPPGIEAAFEEGGSSDSYTWEPPKPTAFVPLSDRPLRAVKYDTGTAMPTPPKKPVESTSPAVDPWFEKHAPNK